ncbi:cystathionine beta-synthase [Schumannella sp. 10F1B-5-1]|uniref:cystathionine beta-synthase n=1 Tax=Schumannella sp. 10F1B-5-1 TaxID=2590780 RepID=UPI00112FDDC6|nr:cystathionine beta-synthase [Schumannella sp. 10F1B-5-1]TPW73437.1 cystathionine beta-synthase [Schumannella sp. 10F1B-5-1]
MEYAESVLDLVGNTPLVKLTKVTEGIQATVLVKVEYVNPGGSSKDRIAVRIIDAAEAEGKLKPGGTIVEPTSGNTGIGLALVAQQRGYRCVFVCPDKVSADKRATLQAYGAEVVVCPTAVMPDDPRSYYSVSDRLAREIPGAFKPDQYSNVNGPRSHYETTGPEIWRDTDQKVTHFVAGVGTGGTISGVGRYLKEVSDGRVQVVGADPEGSVYSGGTGRPYLVEGVGEDFWPTAYDPSVVDEIIASSDAESFDLTRRLAREEGLLVGGSSGLAVASGLKAARRLGPDDVMVILLPDGGRGYLAKVFSDEWMGTHGFLPAGEGATIGEVVGRKGDSIPALVHVHPDETLATAISILGEYNVSTMPVLSAEPPVVLGEVLGAIDERTILAALAGGAALDAPVREFVGPALRSVGMSQPVDVATAALTDVDALLVLDEGKPVTVLTRHDLLDFRDA